MNVPDHLLYAASHEWADLSQAPLVTMGISDHAQSELTDVVYLELPPVGRVVKKGEAFAVIESVKSANDIYAPLSGEIVEVNDALSDAPEAVNTDPYGSGWLVRIRLSHEDETSSLLSPDQYRERLAP